MPLPTQDEAKGLEWPPPAVAKLLDRQDEHEALWSGDADVLMQNTKARRFWHRQAQANADKRREQSPAMHVALASDIATTSADLLFGDDGWRLVIPELDQDTSDGTDQAAGPDPIIEAAQARLDDLREDLDLDGLALEAGETAAALGGVWWRPGWDKSVHDGPLLTLVEPKHAVPEYRFRRLVAVTFWQVVKTGGNEASPDVWRHLERHEIDVARDESGEPIIVDGQTTRRGVILNGLYKGDRASLGKPVALIDLAETAGLSPRVEVPEGLGPIMPRLMPNVLPNRKARAIPFGRSDYDASEDVFDALDEAWSALMRDIRLGKARIFAPEGTLERTSAGPGAGKGFDVDRELIVEHDAAADETGARVSLLQAEVRDTSHLAVIRALTESAVSSAGYAPATFGLGIDGAAESGTARKIRERKTVRTLGKKRRYAQRALADISQTLLAIDKVIFGRDVEPLMPRVDWPDIWIDPTDTATRLQLLRTAQAISIRNAVREAQPDLDSDELDAEVQRILDELGVEDPDTLGADTPGAGDSTPPASGDQPPADGDPVAA